MPPVLIDLFCGEGGTSKGYSQAGFRVFGVDNDAGAIGRYPYPSVRMDWQEGLAYWLDKLGPWDMGPDLIAASPPCQHYSRATLSAAKAKHPDLVGPVRRALLETGVPYVIENVPDAPLAPEAIELCGCMFDLGSADLGELVRLYRPRLFEASFDVPQPEHGPHDAPSLPMFGCGAPGWFYRKHGQGVPAGLLGKVTGTEWMTREGRAQSVPPVFTRYIGYQFLATRQEAAA